jgi:hypothetical protein
MRAVEQVLQRGQVEAVLVDGLHAGENALEGGLSLLRGLGIDGKRTERDVSAHRQQRD